MVKLSEKKKKDFRRDKVLKHANKIEPEFPSFIAGLDTYSGNWDFQMAAPVSYTHLTLPTIYSV